MQEPEMLTNQKYNFNIWEETFDPVFSDINTKSRVNINWLAYSKVFGSKYKTSILKPINNYALNLYPPPKLVSIENNRVRLRQGNHAEFFLLERESGIFFNLDRPWIRQYYQTKEQYDIPSDCFKKVYKFYTPWFVDENVSVSIERPDVDSPFFIYPQQFESHKTTGEEKYIEPNFVPFVFKRAGSHMLSDKFGKIKRQQAMFDIVFDCDDIMIERIKEFYEHH